MPMRGELPIVAMRAGVRASAKETAWFRFLDTVRNRDLQVVIAFCAIGSLIAINLILLVPGYSETVGTLQMFP